MLLGSYTAQGKRKINQDSFICIDYSAAAPHATLGYFALVCDGMGGYLDGEIASQLAVMNARDYIFEMLSDDRALSESFDAASALTTMSERAHEAICAERHERGDIVMATTFVGAFLSDSRATIGHIGDSRVYRIRNGNAERITNDHSPVGRLLREGKITEKESHDHPDRKLVKASLGFSEADPEITEIELADGDVLVFCCDGIHDFLDGEDIAKAAAQYDTANDKAQAIVDAALAADSNDNCTVVVAMSGTTNSTVSETTPSETTPDTASTPEGVHVESSLPDGGLSRRPDKRPVQVWIIMGIFVVLLALVAIAVALSD